MRALALVALLAGVTGCGGGAVDGGWQQVAVPASVGATAVWSFGPADVWVGTEGVLHFDGRSWTEIATPTAGLVADFWGFAPDDLYAVSGVTLLRWDGAAWSALDFGGAIAPTDLQSVWGTSDDDLWIGDSLNSRVFHFDGTSWSTTIAETIDVEDLWGVSGGPGGPLFACGIFGISRFAGGAWSAASGGVAAGGASGLWGFGAADVWAVGSAALAHWDGSAWTDTSPDPSTNFIVAAESVWGAAPDDVWAVGDLGSIDHWDGTAWSQILEGAFPYYPTLTKVHGSSVDDVWAVGVSTDGKNSGVVLHHAR
ncbi:MAG TPA: hypothetical protein VGP64_03135 [Polyangia bacterium]